MQTNHNFDKTEILERLIAAGESFSVACKEIGTEHFFFQPPGKWSIAQHVQHLILSARSTKLAYTLPPFLLRMITGRPNRSSRSYEDLVIRYQTKLQNGGKAGGRFVPTEIRADYGQSTLIDNFSSSMDRLHATIARKWKEGQLDRYLAPHPLLGRITLRELGYFTIYHTYHHLGIVQRLAESTRR